MSSSVLLESPHIQQISTPVKSSTSSSQSYVLSIANLPRHYAASASAPSNVIDIFDKSTLQGVQTLPGHEEATTSLRTVDNIAGITGKTLMSSGKDGSVKTWDERANEHSIKMTNLGKSRALLCADVSPDGLTVAAGTDLQGDDAIIIYWDPRQPATPIRSHSSTHADDITTLSFSKSPSPSEGKNTLLSSSSDGLLSISNADEDDEDEAVVHVGNWGCSVSQAGWIHGSTKSPANSDGMAKIWAASDMETFSTWSEEMDQLLSIDIREPSVHTQRHTWVTDYLISTHSSSTSPQLSVFAGSNEGDIALLSNMNSSVTGAPWCLHKMWTNGHVGVVRSLLWDEENNVLITGGEDSKLNMWSTPPVEFARREENSGMDVDSPPRKREMDMEGEPEVKRTRR